MIIVNMSVIIDTFKSTNYTYYTYYVHYCAYLYKYIFLMHFYKNYVQTIMLYFIQRV